MYAIDRRTEGQRTIFRVLIDEHRGIGLVWCPEGLFWVDASIVRRIEDTRAALSSSAQP
jgi:hypothetical protein